MIGAQDSSRRLGERRDGETDDPDQASSGDQSSEFHRPLPLSVEPDVFAAVAVDDAGHHDRQSLDPGLLADSAMTRLHSAEETEQSSLYFYRWTSSIMMPSGPRTKASRSPGLRVSGPIAISAPLARSSSTAASTSSTVNPICSSP